MQMRLDKFLADAGMGTRSEVKNIIKKKSVTVNGELAARPEMKVDPSTDVVAVNGETVGLRGSVTYLLHKPAGYVCAVRDDRFPTVMELVPPGRDLFPVGRLDKDTEGLLLISNDGAMSHCMLSPRRHVDKTYLAVLDRPAEETDIELFAEGVDIGDDTRTIPARLVLCDVNNLESNCRELNSASSGCGGWSLASSDCRGWGLASSDCGGWDPVSTHCQKLDVVSPDCSELKLLLPGYLPQKYHNGLAAGQVVLLTICEGRYHQVKRMFHAVGKEVVYLKRLTFGEMKLPVTLNRGEFVQI